MMSKWKYSNKSPNLLLYEVDDGVAYALVYNAGNKNDKIWRARCVGYKTVDAPAKDYATVEQFKVYVKDRYSKMETDET